MHLQPDSAELHNGLGVALARQNQLAEAATVFRQAVQCQPDTADARSNLGLAYLQQARSEEAVVHLHRPCSSSRGRRNREHPAKLKEPLLRLLADLRWSCPGWVSWNEREQMRSDLLSLAQAIGESAVLALIEALEEDDATRAVHCIIRTAADKALAVLGSGAAEAAEMSRLSWQ